MPLLPLAAGPDGGSGSITILLCDQELACNQMGRKGLVTVSLTIMQPIGFA